MLALVAAAIFLEGPDDPVIGGATGYMLLKLAIDDRRSIGDREPT